MEQQKIDLETLPKSIELVGIAMNRAVYLDEEYLDPAPSQEIYNHSPDGFNWGYQGSGPAQLALAICARYLGRELAEPVYQLFKARFVSCFPEGNFRVKINFADWYGFDVLGKDLTVSQLMSLMEVLPFEMEDSGMKVMDNLTYTPAPETVTGKKPDNPLI